ncbi:unnamed protein product [Acanthoscelides obtectus]|uniref:RING-type E3 ubiquitin transferase n=1 Tax=Acanthoscelides obtectus TaxID=200917 RepID=A0A9P0PM97_ACAOB|nr:unnamed protein product [Acanthoscelides obtectus]CAK1638391.1 E3 ubiquitin-protein ligase ZNF598 [Acanthoscelides obtectus]
MTIQKRRCQIVSCVSRTFLNQTIEATLSTSMASREEANSSDNENLCVVCFKNVDIYSIGPCDHPVCFECSTRMRVLCRQNECPICRSDMPKVIFTKKVEQFASLFPRLEKSSLQDRKFGLYFRTSEAQRAYYKLLEHRCHICDKYDDRKWPFKTYQQLKDHMRREHELFYCDICVENLKIFTFERRCYTRQELGHHRRKGDPDNTSHRGHPLCEFCDTRYMDNDELFRHLRRTHLFCHLCDADGKHQYYVCMDDLLKHFKEEHFLCEEGDCRNMPLTAVFRSDIDLKAHVATEHSRHMSKSATKQARTLELEFTLAPRPRTDNNRNRRYDNRRIDNDPYDEPGGGPGGGGEVGSGRFFVNPLTPQDFPALGSASGSVTFRPASVNFASRNNSNLRQEDFPSLGGSRGPSALTITTNSASTRSNRAPEVTITRTVRGQQQGQPRRNNDFPVLSGTSSNNTGSSTVRLSVNSQDSHTSPKVSIHVNHRPNGGITTHITTSASSNSSASRPTEAFPALGSAQQGGAEQPQWVQVKHKKQESKAPKVTPTPTLPPGDLQQFPSLQKTKKGNTNTSSGNNWVNLNSMNSAMARNREAEARAASLKPKPPVENKQDNTENKGKKKKKSKDKPLDTEKKKGEQNSANESNNNEDIIKNGMIKKRSEIKIGNLRNTGESSVVSNRSEESTKPPPGFTIKPPPGLSPASFPSLGGVANDLTFTSSSGQSYSITPSIKYHPPVNFHARNQNLIKKVMSILNSDTIKEFKTYSDLFRNGGFPTDNYYAHCKQVLGSNFEEIFPELLVLLPDIDKQQELFRVYDGKGKKLLVICENCKQVIYRKELTEHYSYHTLDSQFPSLDVGKPQGSNGAWKKS